ncbi:MAG: AsmA-like C-terminal region-containing protein [Lysobacterales bacterium]|jgi:uncharacterized protein involved in outer membrane biogenesis
MNMRRYFFISALLIVLALLLGGAVAVYLLHDQDFLKARIATLALDRTGRRLVVDGPLQIDLGRNLQLNAADIHYANAPWASQADMVSIGRLAVRVNLLSLLRGIPHVEFIRLDDCRVLLEESPDGDKNWEVLSEQAEPPAPETEESGQWPLLLDQLRISNCSVTHSAPRRTRPLVVEIGMADMGIDDKGRWQTMVEGTFAGRPLSLTGWLIPARAVLEGGRFEHELKLQLGDTELQSSGVVGDLGTGAGSDLRLSFRGPDIGILLEQLLLPPLSSGPFDFQSRLQSLGPGARLTVDGDLGTLRIDADASLDRLLHPTSGAATLAVKGPNLEAIGQVLGVPGLSPDAYTLTGDLSYTAGVLNVRSLSLETAGDRIDASGTIGDPPDSESTALDIDLHGNDIGRWRPAFGLPQKPLGPLSGRASVKGEGGAISVKVGVQTMDSSLDMDGTSAWPAVLEAPDFNIILQTPDARNLARIADLEGFPSAPARLEGRVQYREPTLQLHSMKLDLGTNHATAEGTINTSKSLAGSALDITIESPSAVELGRLFGLEDLPAAPLSASGHVERTDQRYHLKDVVLKLSEHRLQLDGDLDPTGAAGRSELDVGLQSPDMGALGNLFGIGGLPHESLKISGSVSRNGKSLAFRTQQADVASVRLAIEGNVPDLDQPFRLDARFDTHLPSLEMLGFLLPDTDLPNLPFGATGEIRTRDGRTSLAPVKLTLGSLDLEVMGDILPDTSFSLQVDAGTPDLSALSSAVGVNLPPQAFSIHTAIEGAVEAFRLTDLAASLGESRINGSLEVQRGERTGISGSLESGLLDLSPWMPREQQQPTKTKKTEKKDKRWLFDDTPVLRVTDLGIDLDLGLHVNRLQLPQTRFLDIDLTGKLTSDRLLLGPFSLSGQQRGHLEGTVDLDGRGAKPELTVGLTAENVRLGISAVEGQDPSTVPPSDILVQLHAIGDTNREMASSLNGKLRLYSGSGQIASAGAELLLSDFLTELFEELNPFAKDSPYTRLDCTVVAAEAADGVINVGPAVVNMKKLTILSSGQIDLRDESIDLAFNSRPRTGLGITAGTIINPLIKVGGHLATPEIELNPKGAVISGGAAVATAGISVLAKSLYDRFLTSKDPCGDARREIEQRDQSN